MLRHSYPLSSLILYFTLPSLEGSPLLRGLATLNREFSLLRRRALPC